MTATNAKPQVVLTVMSHDLENDPDILAMVAASAALTLSGVPFMGPIGGARVGLINDELVLNPTIDQMEDSKLDLIVAGTQDAVLMVESEAQNLTEKTMLDAVMFGHRGFQPVIEAIIKLAEKAAKEPREFSVPDHSDLAAKVEEIASEGLAAAFKIAAKTERYNAIDAVKEKVFSALCNPEDENAADTAVISDLFKKAEAKIVRGQIIETGSRIDGRDLKTVRPIVSEVGILPRTHGSALFTRGETQAMVCGNTGHRR